MPLGTKIEEFTPDFCDAIPPVMEEGVLYICKKYKASQHLCACGCGSKIVTPLTPGRWELTERGNNRVTLDPSIGAWSYDCQSHYWIRNNRVDWYSKWSEEAIEANREWQRGNIRQQVLASQKANATPRVGAPPWWRRFWNWLARK